MGGLRVFAVRCTHARFHFTPPPLTTNNYDEQGLPEGDVRDAYPGVLEDLKAMVQAGDLIALKVWEGCRCVGCEGVVVRCLCVVVVGAILRSWSVCDGVLRIGDWRVCAH